MSAPRKPLRLGSRQQWILEQSLAHWEAHGRPILLTQLLSAAHLHGWSKQFRISARALIKLGLLEEVQIRVGAGDGKRGRTQWAYQPVLSENPSGESALEELLELSRPGEKAPVKLKDG